MLHILVSGVIYEVRVSLNCSAKITNDEININIRQIIKEDSITLFGFVDKDEMQLFNALIKISGIGPSTALAVCSTFSPKNFANIILSEDISMIKRVPGIGPKSAKRLLVEMSDFAQSGGGGESYETITASDFKRESLEALMSLGFKKDKILSVFKACTSTDTASLVKEALKKLA
jgi:Holliday junction DNA helicase RuvA